jgi:hypothetical protein
MNSIKSRETSSNGVKEELQFITNILDAKEKDLEGDYDQICRPDHLYALIQSKPDYIKRCVDLRSEYKVSNKGKNQFSTFIYVQHVYVQTLDLATFHVTFYHRYSVLSCGMSIIKMTIICYDSFSSQPMCFQSDHGGITTK